MFKKIMALGIVSCGLFFAQSAIAAGDLCSVAKDEWVSKDAVTQKLEAEGWKVRKLKVENGCYEAYALKGDKRAEVLVNPKTLEIVKVQEAD
jgi:hypothetical protein